MKKLFKLLLIVGLSVSTMAMDEGKTGCEDGYNVDCKKNPELCKGGTQTKDEPTETKGGTQDVD
jgi:hypothetical protein